MHAIKCYACKNQYLSVNDDIRAVIIICPHTRKSPEDETYFGNHAKGKSGGRRPDIAKAISTPTAGRHHKGSGSKV